MVSRGVLSGGAVTVDMKGADFAFDVRKGAPRRVKTQISDLVA